MNKLQELSLSGNEAPTINSGVEEANAKLDVLLQRTKESDAINSVSNNQYCFVFAINIEGKAEPFFKDTDKAIKEWFDEKASDVISKMRDENLRDTFTVVIEDKRLLKPDELDILIHQKLADKVELSEQEKYLKWGVKKVLKRDNAFIKSALEMFLSNRVLHGALAITHYTELKNIIQKILELRYGDLCNKLPNNRELISLDVYLNANGRNSKHEQFVTYVRRSDVEDLFGGAGVFDLCDRSVMELSNCREDVIVHYVFFLAELDLSEFDFSKDDRLLNLMNFWIGLH